MAQVKKTAKRKRRKIALPVMGAAGVSLALAGGAPTISKARAADILSPDTASPREITFAEEEIADVSLATFYVFDKEAEGTLQDNVILAQACGGCRGCAVARCGVRDALWPDAASRDVPWRDAPWCDAAWRGALWAAESAAWAAASAAGVAAALVA